LRWATRGGHYDTQHKELVCDIEQNKIVIMLGVLLPEPLNVDY